MAEAAPKPVVSAEPSDDDLRNSKKMIADLRGGRLPQMVNWWDASVLAMVGVRNMISATIGDYADQRPMQAAADIVPEAELTARHDYRNVCRGGRDKDGHIAIEGPVDQWSLTKGDATKCLAFDAQGALWIDFIADLGDGFEATYAMAYLMAKPSIAMEIPDTAGKTTQVSLPAGDILIMGGDMAYPNSSIKEYHARCVAPYDAAFQLKEGEPPKRKLFFIAGNHDWYDGLAAFTSVFCSARDRLAKGKGLTIGGWQSEQRRSYFALALPHGWWFWGVDLALSETIDDAQRNYFEAMSLETNPGEKIIIILHAPVWQNKDDSPLHEVSQWARRKGADVVAVLAGDLHFYSRYHSQRSAKPSDAKNELENELQLITSGGGGAFLHPTHQQPRTMQVHWTVPKVAKAPAAASHASKSDYRDTVLTVTAAEPIFDKSKPFTFHAPHIYPSKAASMLLALKNLWLPIHNREFATFIGLIYLVFAWVFQISVADPTDAVKRAQTAGIQQECILYNPLAGAKRDKCVSDRNAALTKTMQSTDQKTSGYVQPSPPAGAVASNSRDLGLPGVADMDSKWFIDWLAQAKQGGWLELARDFIWTQISVERIVSAMLSNPAFFFMIAGLFSGLIYYVGNGDAEFKPRWLKWPVKFALGIPHASAHVFILLATNVVLQPILGIFTKDGTAWPWMLVGVGLYSLLMVLIGGLLGGMLFGLYWVLTSIIGRMHMDSFGALGITGYKNFLRLRIMPDTLTIYPIGLDKVPGRNGWRALTRDDDASMHNPLIKPKSPLRPRLIEPPIEIVAPAAQRRPAPGWT